MRAIEEIQRLLEVTRIVCVLDQSQRITWLIIYSKPTLVFCSSVAFLDVQNFRAEKAWALGFKFQLCHLLATVMTLADTNTLSLGFLICKMWKMKVLYFSHEVIMKIQWANNTCQVHSRSLLCAIIFQSLNFTDSESKT